MAVVNPAMISPVIYPAPAANVKDSRWLTLDVCREFTRNKCSRSDDECRFAHPPPNVEVQNGRVMCCFDSIKGKCQRRDPPCKYLHPPQHLKEQLLQNGRNNLILKHLQMQMIAQSIPGCYPVMYDVNTGKSFSAGYIPLQTQDPYLAAAPRYILPNTNGYASTYYAAAGPYTTAAPPAAPAVTSAGVYPASTGSGGPTCNGSATGIPYSLATTVDNGCGQQLVLVSSPASNGHQNGLQLDRPLENGSCHNGSQQPQPGSPVWSCGNGAPPSPALLPVDTTGPGATYTTPIYFQTTNGMSGMMPMMKQNSAASETKCGMPFYQPFAYQQMALAAMQLQQPTYVPITIAGHPPLEPRY
jgi:hypothetical protein